MQNALLVCENQEQFEAFTVTVALKEQITSQLSPSGTCSAPPPEAKYAGQRDLRFIYPFNLR